MSRYKAVGCHVFAGAFTMGVREVFDVECQLEKHGFGRESCEQVAGVPFVNHDDAQWPDVEAQLCYGNPRCTGFSCITAGYGEDCHGPWAKQTLDIHELCHYAAGRCDLVIWESVQQAFTTGRPMLDYLRDEIFAPRGYRIAHVLLNAASFWNAQQRRRYFFVAYRDDRNFNIRPPGISPYEPTLYDAIWHLRDRPAHEGRIGKKGEDYDFDTYLKLTKNEKHVLPKLPNGWGLNGLARWDYDSLHPDQKLTWDARESNMPFSMHCIYRTNWMRPSPTLHSSAGRFIHPDHDRPLTVGELSTIMGWPDVPRGAMPVAQIAKGVTPQAGRWLAEQAKAYLDDEWGSEDWESSYNPNTAVWEGRSARGQLEKTFDLTRYVGRVFNRERFDVTEFHGRRFNVQRGTGRTARPWSDVAESVRRHAGDDRLGGPALTPGSSDVPDELEAQAGP